MIRKLFLFVFFLISHLSFSQCFQIRDGLGAFNPNPTFVSCTPGNYTIFIQPDTTIGPFSISWGDASPDTSGLSLLTSGNISHTYLATTDTFVVIVTDSATMCADTGVVIMERNPLASIQLPAGDDNFGCTPVAFRFVNSSTQISQTTTFEWNFGDGTPVQVFDFNNQGDTVTHNYLPGVGVQSCDIQVDLTATNNCGTSTASFFPLQVWDLDDADIIASATLLCYPDTVVQYTNNTTRNCFAEGNQSQRFEKWNFGNHWGMGADSIIDFRPWNPPIINPPPIAYPGVGTYTVMLIDSSFCGLDTATLMIQITNPPTSVLGLSKDTICEGETVTIQNNSIGGANEFQWDFDLGGGFQNLNGANKDRTYNTTGDYTISLVVGIAGSQGCNDTATIDLHVLPSPVSDFTFDANNQCDSMQVNFTDNSTGAIANYDWDFGNGNTFSGINPPTQNYTSPGAYTIRLTTTTAEGCSHTVQRTINVRETPRAGFTVNTVCLNLPSNFVDTSQASVDPITTYKWFFGDGDSSNLQDPSHIYTSGGNFLVTQIVDNGFCQDTATFTVTVENPPAADFMSDSTNGCSPFTVNFTNQSSAGAVSYRWNFGDGSAISNAVDTSHTFFNNSAADTSFIVQLIATTVFGCTDTTFDTISVSPVPQPSFTSDATLDCGPLVVNFTNNTSGTNLTFEWDFGDSTPVSNDVNPTHIFENQTLFISNFDVQLVVTSANGCSDTIVQTISVFPEPVFTFVTQPDSGCSPLNVRFPSVVGAVSYQWDFGDGSTGTGPTPTHTYVNNTTNDQSFTARLIAQNAFGCRDTTFGTILVYPNPTSDFTLDTNVGCQPLPIDITNLSLGANSFDWDFDDGTTSDTAAASFVKTYNNTSSSTSFHTIRLITETNNGCRDTLSRLIEVHPFIQAAFTSDTVGCSPKSISFINQSIGATNYLWRFGDTNTSNVVNPQHVYQNSTMSNQNYTATLVTQSLEGCLDSAQRNILIYPKPLASYTVSDTLGCHPLNVLFTNNSLLADSCAWSYGDQSSFNLCSPTNSHIYLNTSFFTPADYLSELVVFTNNGCRDTMTREIRINPQIIADFNADTVGCSPFAVQFQDRSNGAQDYSWTFGDGDSSSQVNVGHLFVNSSLLNTTYTSKLKVTSAFGCVDSLEQDILVYPKPTASYTVSDTIACHPATITFTNSSVLADSCAWSYGDQSSFDLCVTNNHVYSNTSFFNAVDYLSELIVFTNNGCTDTMSRSIRINPQIIADFNSDTIGCSPFLVQFLDRSNGVQDYQWSFGDGDSSNQVNVGHLFVNSSQLNATYTTKLKVTSAFGCVDSLEQDILVYPKPTASYTISDSIACHPATITFTNSSVLADSCAWKYGDQNEFNGCSLTNSHTYTNITSIVPIDFLSELIVFTNNGCKDTMDRNIRINPQIIADFGSDTAGCHPFSVQFQNSSTGAQNHEWFFGDGGSSIQIQPQHFFLNPGQQDANFTTKLRVTSAFGCVDSLEQEITVFPKPLADYSINSNSGCHPFQVEFTNNSLLADSCVWRYGDNTNLSVCDPITNHTYNNTLSLVPINFQPELLVFTNNGCSDTLDRTVEVRPLVIADFSSDTLACSPLNTTFRSQSFGAIDFRWDFGDGAFGSGILTTHQYTNTGSVDSIYTVRLIAESMFNCNDTIFRDIRVRPTPIPDFDPTPLVQQFPSSSVNVDNTTNNGNWTYQWDFGDSTTSTLRDPDSIVYETWGNISLNLLPHRLFVRIVS